MTDKRILFADRNRNVREFLKREFEAIGYKALLAGDGISLLRMLDSDDPPDLLVMDLDLPYIGGLEILNRLRNRMPPTPVLVHSFQIQLAANELVRACGEFVEKKADLQGLKNAVAKAFDRSGTGIAADKDTGVRLP